LRTAFPVVCALFVVAAPASAQTSLTGNWSGTYAYSIQLSACQNKTFSSNGNGTLTFLQTGSSLQGRADLTDALIFSGNCSPAKGELTSVVFGTLDGSSVVWAFPNDPIATQFTGSVSADTITVQLSDDAGGTGTLTVSRTSPDPMAVDVTGTWSGSYTFTDRCSNGATQSYSGALTLGLTESDGRAGGVVTIPNVPLYDSSCRKITALNMEMSVSGVVSGSTFTGAVFDPSGSFEFPITATINGGTMSGTVSGANQTNTTGSFMLTRGSTQPPASDFGGSYTGTYTEIDDETFRCLNIGSLRFSGPVSISIAQAGNAVASSLIFHQALDVQSDGFGGCVPVNIGDEVLPLYGQLSNNTLSVVLPVGSSSALFTVTFAGNTIQGTITDSFGDVATFSATKTAAPAIPGPRRRVVRS
jgi:hypothetical protein